MGLIDFIKDVGHKLEQGGAQAAHGQQPAAQKPQAQAAPAQPSQPNTADLDRQKAAALFAHLQQLGLASDDLSVRVDGDKATLSGRAASQEAKEKIVLAVGNSQGIATVDDQLQGPQAQQEQPTYYDVKSGDTLSKVAKQFYGDANRYNEIFEANKPMLKSADAIYPGQKLRIPAAQTVGQHA
jgi:nucleoid-associated protein YgaU